MAHSHPHGSHAGHGHAGHSHGVSADADVRKLAIALALIVAFMAAEVVVGFLSGSLALLSDAAHMLTDAAALGPWRCSGHAPGRPAAARRVTRTDSSGPRSSPRRRTG